MKGVSRPRDTQIYADLAAVLGLEGGPVFFQTSSFEAFSKAVMRGRRGAGRIAAAGLGAKSTPTSTHTYACFSPAWSVTKSGEIVIGRLALGAFGDRVQAEYSEVHAGKTYPYTGELTLRGTTMFGMLTSPMEDLSIYLCLCPPPHGCS